MKLNKQTKVIIIGAGISGLTCARDLLSFNNQLDVTILEGSNRIGGRVNSIKVEADGTTLELGAHYFHGTVGNPLYEYAIEKGMIKKKTNEFRPYEMKHCFDKDLKKTCSEEMLTNAYQEGFDYKNQLFENIVSQFTSKDLQQYTSMGQYVVTNFEKKLQEYNGDLIYQSALKSVFACTLNDEADSNGCTSMYDLDFEGFVSYIDLQGDLYCMSNDSTTAYSDIVLSIHNEIEKDCVKLNHIVDQIERYEDKFTVTCRNGNSFHCDFIVSTVSVGVLKQFISHHVFHNINLPLKKLKSIEKLQVGQITKLYVKFKNPVQSEIRYIRFYPLVKDFKRDSFSMIQSIYTCERIAHSDWWLIWLNTDLTKEYENNTPEIFLENLSMKLNELYPDLNNKLDTNVFYASSWTTDELYKGSYSYLPVGSKQSDIMELQAPVMMNSGGLLFAGELTEPSCYGTTHAAYASGMREARRIINLLEKQSS